MSGYRGDDDDELPPWLRDDTSSFEPLDAGEDEASIDLPRFALRPNLKPAPEMAAADPRLLKALAGAERAVARLDARASTLPEHLRDALVVRMAHREAVGWLARVNLRIHPEVLAMWALGLTGNVISTSNQTQSGSIPSLAGISQSQEDISRPEVLDDRKMRLAHLLVRQLVWLVNREERPLLDDPETVREALLPTGDADAQTVLAAFGDALEGLRVAYETQPVLLGVIAAGNAWLALDAGDNEDERDLRSGLVMAIFAREDQRLRWVPLSLWATIKGQRFRGNSSPFGTSDRNVIDLLDMIHEGALAALRDLDWLIMLNNKAEETFAQLTKRSILRSVFHTVMRQPIVTPKSLVPVHKVSRKAINIALAKLVSLGLLQEITRRPQYHIFALPN